MCSANGPPTPGLLVSLADDAKRDIALGHAQTLGRIQQLQNFGATSIHRRRATHGRFILTTFLCTLQRLTSTPGLIQPLQHSILGVWLALTQTGFPPASQSDLASPHVHFFVICRWQRQFPQIARSHGQISSRHCNSRDVLSLASTPRPTLLLAGMSVILSSYLMQVVFRRSDQ